MNRGRALVPPPESPERLPELWVGPTRELERYAHRERFAPSAVKVVRSAADLRGYRYCRVHLSPGWLTAAAWGEAVQVRAMLDMLSAFSDVEQTEDVEGVVTITFRARA